MSSICRWWASSKTVAMTFSILTAISQPIRFCSYVARLQSELEKLLAGQASVGIAKKLGVSRMDLQRFIAGEVSMAYAPGRLQPQAQELRNRMEREGAVSVIIRIGAKASQRQPATRERMPSGKLEAKRDLGAYRRLFEG